MNQDEAKKLLRLLTAPGVWQFLDTRKLSESEQFLEMSDYAVLHLTQYGDTRPVASLLRLFADSVRFEPIVKWMCARAGLRIWFVGDDLYMRKDEDASPQSQVPLRKYLSEATGRGTASDMARQWREDSGKTRRSAQKQPQGRGRHQDALAPWRVLPGCFEHGKRR